LLYAHQKSSTFKTIAKNKGILKNSHDEVNIVVKIDNKRSRKSKHQHKYK